MEEKKKRFCLYVTKNPLDLVAFLPISFDIHDLEEGIMESSVCFKNGFVCNIHSLTIPYLIFLGLYRVVPI